MSEKELVVKAKAGDAKAFTELYGLYKKSCIAMPSIGWEMRPMQRMQFRIACFLRLSR